MSEKKDDKSKQDLDKELDAAIEGLGDAGKTVKELLEKGILSKKPSSLDDLPEDLKKKILEQIDSAKKESEKTIKAQLYETIEKHKADGEGLRKALNEITEKATTEEQKRIAELEAERMQRLSTEERLKELENANSQKLAEMQTEMEKRMESLNQALHIEKLKTLREKALAVVGDKHIPEIIIDPDKNPTATEEELLLSVQASNKRYLELEEKLSSEAQKRAEEEKRKADEEASLHQRSDRFGNLNALTTKREGGEEIQKLLATGTKESLQKAIDLANKKYGF